MVKWLLVMVLFAPQGPVTSAIPMPDKKTCLAAVRAVKQDPTRQALWAGTCVKLPDPTPPVATPPETGDKDRTSI